MLNGLYASAAGIMGQQLRVDAIAHDLANLNTPGFRSQRVAFADLVYQATGVDSIPVPASRLGAGVRAGILDRSLKPGALLQTDQPFDLAIEGPGFFQVQRADGSVALTRDGSFKVDDQGRLVTAGGSPLVPPVRIPAGSAPSSVSVSADGRVQTQDGQLIGRIVVVDVPVPQQLMPAGDNLFVPTQASGAPQPANPGQARIRQGFLEGSNVDLAENMTQLIEAQRALELNARVLRTADDVLAIANQIKR